MIARDLLAVSTALSLSTQKTFRIFLSGTLFLGLWVCDNLSSPNRAAIPGGMMKGRMNFGLIPSKIAIFQKVALAALDAFEVLFLRVVGLGAIVYELAKIFLHR